MKLLAALLLSGCAVAPPPVPRAARSDAAPGRLAGAPASLRAGVVTYPDLPAAQTAPPAHHHHHP